MAEEAHKVRGKAERFADQQRRNAHIKEASALVNQLNTFSAGVTKGAGATDGGSDDYAVGHRDMGVALAKQFAATDDPNLRGKILEFYKLTTGRDMELVNGQPTPRMTDASIDPNVYIDRSHIAQIDTNAWQAKIGDVKSLQDGFTKDNELSMITLQSLVSQRQLGVTMGTQLIASMSETSKQVLGNLGK